MPEKLAGVKQVKARRADGSTKIFYYHRATMQRLPDDPASPSFASALARLNRESEAAALVGDRNLFSLIRQYCNSPDWKDLAESTRKIETFNLRAIEDEFGDMPLAAIEERGARSEFLSWRDRMADATPRAADAKLARLARILAFGVDRELLLVNPLATFKRVYKGNRSEIIWTPRITLGFGFRTHFRKPDGRQDRGFPLMVPPPAAIFLEAGVPTAGFGVMRTRFCLRATHSG